MIITIYEGYDNTYVILKSKDENFRKEYGRTYYEVNNEHFYESLATISSWCNNEIGEECLFEIG